MGVAAAALAIAIRPGATEPWIRLTGLVLQVLGLGTVLWGIGSLRAYFHHPSYRRLLADWLREGPFLVQSYTLKIEPGKYRLSGSDVRLTRGIPIPESGSVDDRFKAVERSLTIIRDELRAHEDRTTAALRDLQQTLSKQVQDEIESRESLHAHLEAAATGGVHVSIIGTFWLFLGVVLSTAAPELMSLLK